MWPFKSKPAMTVEEYAATRPPAPCGEQTKHVFWTEMENMTCPVCEAKANRVRREKDEDRMAEKIAAAVIRQMNIRHHKS